MVFDGVGNLEPYCSFWDWRILDVLRAYLTISNPRPSFQMRGPCIVLSLSSEFDQRQWHFEREWSITTCWAAFQGLDLRFTTNSFWRVGTKVAHFKNIETLQNVRLSFYTTTILITYILLNVHMQDGAGHVESEFQMKTAGHSSCCESVAGLVFCVAGPFVQGG